MFNSESIPCVTTRRVDRHNVGMVHITLQTLLNSTRKSDGKKFSHAELARALNVSEQVVTNWSKRGVSVEGALAAQYAFGQDANFILGRVSHPMVLPRPAVRALHMCFRCWLIWRRPMTRQTTRPQSP